ncbi:hypothetical protein MN116_001526 [Schistosoma mekongi]|uniref:Fasciclin-2 n=1 Tax=Schistosoma mekongi TaxID=38744 RepID=A0AAE1ZI31_SCHME|nr:hypothetical protein MN116_001526 [Schistosoma mekongi]
MIDILIKNIGTYLVAILRPIVTCVVVITKLNFGKNLEVAIAERLYITDRRSQKTLGFTCKLCTFVAVHLSFLGARCLLEFLYWSVWFSLSCTFFLKNILITGTQTNVTTNVNGFFIYMMNVICKLIMLCRLIFISQHFLILHKSSIRMQLANWGAEKYPISTAVVMLMVICLLTVSFNSPRKVTTTEIFLLVVQGQRHTCSMLTVKAMKNYAIFLISVVCFYQRSETLHIKTKSVCSNRDQVSIIGGDQRRLVTEGGRVTLICCVLGRSNGHDHEQLVWNGPDGKELVNYFSNPLSDDQHNAYSVPDFHLRDHLVTMMVIQKFQSKNTGQYTCRNTYHSSTALPASVFIDVRPRLLEDFIPLPPSSPEDSSSAVVAGVAVSVALEEGRRGEIVCRVNPKLNLNDVQLTWFFQGRQLITPSIVIKQMGQKNILKVKNFSHENHLAKVENSEMFLPSSNEGSITPESNQLYTEQLNRPVALDPEELGIQISQDGQVLDIPRVDTRHSGIFLCKAETVNPTWSPQNSEYDTRLYESGVVTAPFLVQIQAIRGIVYSRPRLLPGSPMEIFAPTDPDESQLVSPYKHFISKRQDEPRLNAVQNSPNYLQTILPLWRDNDMAKEKLNMASTKKIVQEGGKLILECQARGRPRPQLLWYRGGMGSSTTHNSQAVTFDQRIKLALQHLPLDDIQRELGILIADFEHLFPSVINMENISSEVVNQPSANPGAIYRKGIQTHELGRFQLSTGLRKDDRGDPVIAVSRLTINNLMPPDATRYTCLALLNLNHYGGVGNFTDVGSILPDVVLRPRFVHSGTRLKASGYPGESCRLTCEAYGGLPTEMGLRVRLLKGPGVNKLISHVSYSLYPENNNPMINSYEDISEPQSIYNNPSDLWNGMNYESNNSDFIEIVKPGMNPRYHLKVEPDPRNPYATILRLDITDLTPEDNSFYVCEALSGPHWRAITPTSSEPPGRVTVWFAPPAAEPRRVGEISDQLETDESETSSQSSKYVVYGLSHFPSKIACQALGQPTPQWKWVGPQSGPSVPLGELNDPKGYIKTDYQDGEYSVTELTVPAGYWNVGVFGTYSCTASNRLGYATGHVRLQLASHPGQPTLRACKVEATLIELCVGPPNKTGGLPLTHYELRIQTHPGGALHGPFVYLRGHRVLRLPNLIPGYYYRFALSAVSRAGRGPNAYLQVTTNRLSKPVIKLLASQDYISPTGYNVHWNTETTNGMDINQYNINIRPVEVDYSLGEIAGRPIGSWTHYNNIEPRCVTSMAEDQKICNFLINDLKPDSVYELELSGQNSMGFSETQRIIFRTSSITGVSGRILNMPSTMRLTGKSSHILITNSLLLLITILHFKLIFNTFVTDIEKRNIDFM